MTTLAELLGMLDDDPHHEVYDIRCPNGDGAEGEPDRYKVTAIYPRYDTDPYDPILDKAVVVIEVEPIE